MLKRISIAAALLGVLLTTTPAYGWDKKSADEYYAQKSYRLAEEEYAKHLEGGSREVRFKWADSVLKGNDETSREKAQNLLAELIGEKEEDRWKAEAEVSLASDFIAREPWNKTAEVQNYLDEARNYWAGSDDVETARAKFIAVSFQLADYETSRGGWYANGIRPIRLGGKAAAEIQPQGNTGLRVLYEEILKIAANDEDKAKAHYGLAMTTLMGGMGEPKAKEKMLAEFATVIHDYPRSEWVDDSYYQLGMYYEGQSDFIKAQETYAALLKTFRVGESKYLDEAKNRMQAIVEPALNLSVGSSFVPGSEVQFSLNWRNVTHAQITLYKLDMTKELNLTGNPITPRGYSSYQELLQLVMSRGQYYKGLPVQASWTQALEDDGKHVPHGEYKGMADWRKPKDATVDAKLGILPAGAYLLVAQAGEKQPVYDLVLVSDLAIVSKTSKDTALFFATDAKTGKPAGKTDITYIYSYNEQNGASRWAEGHGITDENGLLKAQLEGGRTRSNQQQHNLFATAKAGESQSFVQNSYYYYDGGRGQWWLYAFSDRPAYRPGETVSFKGMLRRSDQGAFKSDAGMEVKARIFSPVGTQIKEGTYHLNEYGAFDDTLALEPQAPLGEYRIELYTADLRTQLSTAQLFRVEEYKLPEFIVNVHADPKTGKDGKPASYRLGDKVNVSVDAQYYFGGAVADAQIEYLVYQRPFVHGYRFERPYGWYYADMIAQPAAYWGNGTLLKQEKIKADAPGKAHFTLETPKDAQGDQQYHIEVRVVDKSRREIRGSSDIKVTHDAFFAYMEPKQSLYRPGDKAEVTIRTMNADDQPVSVEGKVVLLRRSWHEGVASDKAIVAPGDYASEEKLTKFVKTNDKGEAVFTFEPDADGYYAVEFTGFDEGKEVKSQAQLFVCDRSSTSIGYRYGGLQIITEKDTFKVGETARAMIVTDKPDSWVLLTTEADDLYGAQVLHVDGTVKLVEIPVQANFTPNVFFDAASADHYQLKVASQQVIVPPAEKFLNIKVTSDKAVYKPQEEGNYELLVTDKDGKPVSAEIALGLTDSAVYSIQDEFAGDIRQFFYGTKRQQSVQTQTSFYQRPYVNLARDDNGMLVGENERQKNSGAISFTSALGGVAQNSNRAFNGMSRKESVAAESDMSISPGSLPAPPAPAMLAAPAAPEMAMKAKSFDKLAKDGALDEKKAIGGKQQEEQVRNDFRSTVVWLASVKTDAAGKATLKAKFPDSLTTWRMTARADTPETAVGTVTHEVKSNKDLMVRLEAPRFFTERDLVEVSALIDNLTDAPVTVSPSIKADGVTVSGFFHNGVPVKGELAPVQVAAHGQQRIEWAVSAMHAGTAKIKVSAQAGTLSDAMEKTYPVIPHGIEKFIAQSVTLKGGEGEQVKEFTVTLPEQRIKQSSSLRLMLSPSLAGNLLDALPYLANYPYGCVEQTMSRFLPSVIVAKSMKGLGIPAASVDAYIADVLEPRGDPKGHPERSSDPSYSRLRQITGESLTRLYDFQHGDGGWGWWKTGESDPFMSAYVLWGMGMAREAGVEVKSDVIARGGLYLQQQLVKAEYEPDTLAWMLHALAQVDSRSAFEDKQRARLWEMRDKLNPYTRALFALSEHRRGDTEKAKVLSQNLIDGIEEDKANGTAHWGEAGVNYRWSQGGVEATAFAISALSQIDAQSPYLEPAVKWMTLNRRGASWKNTRDTAIAVLGLADYLKASQELSPDYGYKIMVNGEVVREGRVDASNVFSFNRIIDLPAEKLHDGANRVKIVMTGKGALYASAYAKYFTLEEPITAASNEIAVTRKYFIQSVKPTLMKGYTNDWKLLADGDTIHSGDRVRVEVTLDAKNHYEYLLAEDYKPAGLEAVELKSGEGTAMMLDAKGHETGEATPFYQEFRDQKAAFFIGHLKQGRHLIRYELRAEIPGEFHAMPDQLHAMYVPEIRANSDEMQLKVTDPEPEPAKPEVK